MKTPRLAAQSRTRLDERFKEMRPVARYSRPVRGWVKAIREALGMSTAQLAGRLGIKQPSVVAIEQSEAKGTIQLATLQRVAAALDCTLVYALVPNKPLEQATRDRARLFARRRLEPVEHSMLLEDQQVKRQDVKRQQAAWQDTDAKIDEILRETSPRKFWD